MPRFDFYLDLQKIVSQKLSNLGITPPISSDLDDLLTKYLNVLNRKPNILKWNIEESVEIKSKTLDESIRQGYEQFKNEARAGNDLTPYLSTKISDPDFVDLLFYDWGIYHFHLGTHLDSRGFINRSGDILFATFNIENYYMYLIDIQRHGGGYNPFIKQNFIKILEKNWPTFIDKYKVYGNSNIEHNPSDEEIQEFRKNGINYIMKTPGGRFIFSMGGGFTTAKTSVDVRTQADTCLETIHFLHNHVNSYEFRKTFESFFHLVCDKSWSDLVFEMKNFFEYIYIIEKNTEYTVYHKFHS